MNAFCDWFVPFPCPPMITQPNECIDSPNPKRHHRIKTSAGLFASCLLHVAPIQAPCSQCSQVNPTMLPCIQKTEPPRWLLPSWNGGWRCWKLSWHKSSRTCRDWRDAKPASVSQGFLRLHWWLRAYMGLCTSLQGPHSVMWMAWPLGNTNVPNCSSTCKQEVVHFHDCWRESKE